MIGNNEIHINQATMLEAVNLWLAAKFKTAPNAIDVRKNTNPTNVGSEQFIIKVSSAVEK